jgi:protein-tyrosine phosphatase
MVDDGQICDDEHVHYSGFRYWNVVDVRDLADEWNPPYLYAEKIFNVVRILNTHDTYKVVVCCGAGISRSNSIALGYLIYKGFRFDEAMKLIEEKVPIASIEPGHIKAIKQLFGIKNTFGGKTLE